MSIGPALYEIDHSWFLLYRKYNFEPTADIKNDLVALIGEMQKVVAELDNTDTGDWLG